MSRTINRDMLSKPMYEVESIIKANRENDMAVGSMAMLSALKGNQFGHELFTTVIKFKDLQDFLEVFPAVQRNIVPRRVARIKNYILTYLEDRTQMRFFPAITVTARGSIFYDETNNRVAIDTHNSKLSINDGQHRFFGAKEAIKEMETRLSKNKDSSERQAILSKIEELKEMSMPMTIFNNLTETEEKQLFHDTNNLSQRPSRSATIRLAQTDLFAVLAREVAQGSKYLNYYGVEYNKMSIGNNNPNTVLLTTIYSMIKLLFHSQYKADYGFLTKENYSHYKEQVTGTLNDLFFVLPPDLNVKRKYILDKNYALKGLAKFIHHCRELLKIEDDIIFKAIGKVDWTTNMHYWSNYGAYPSVKGLIQFTGNGEGGIVGVFNACLENLPDSVVTK